LSQKIYLDDCAYATELVRLPEAVGHQVTTPRQAGPTGRQDEIHLRYAIDNNLTIVKTKGGVAHFFHNGPSTCHNNMAFFTLWRQTIVKMASGFFHNGPAGWRLVRTVRTPVCHLPPCVKKVAQAWRWQRKRLLGIELT
jgi:hypothetical protein